MSDFFIEFLTRAGCHLCEDAEPGVRRVAARARAALVVNQIDTDPELAVAWDLRIPVVRAPDGSILREGRFTENELLRSVLLARLRRLVPGFHAGLRGRGV